jgi:molybdopterin-binding protein
MEIFKGAVDDLTISVQGGLQLGAVLTNDGQAESDLHEGERVFARIQPEDIHIVAA